MIAATAADYLNSPTERPPVPFTCRRGINPLLVASGNLARTFLLAPVPAGAVLLTAFSYLWHCGVRRQRWP